MRSRAVLLRKVKLVPPPNQRPLSAWKGLRFLLMFPDDPRQVSVGLARPTAMVEPGVLSAGASKPAGIPNSADAQAWVGRSVDPKAMGRALAR
jgi:hypothetical protein